MKPGESGHRRYAIQPVGAVLPDRRLAEKAGITDAAASSQSEPAHTARQATGTSTRQTRGLGRVLVVDDDEATRRLIAANLALEGFEVATAVDGQDCLEKVPAIAPDVITLDVTMPRLDGWETALRLRKCPGTSHIKLVLITARAQDASRTQHGRADADAYLTKPFDPGEMIRVVRALARATGARALQILDRPGALGGHHAAAGPAAARVCGRERDRLGAAARCTAGGAGYRTPTRRIRPAVSGPA